MDMPTLRHTRLLLFFFFFHLPFYFSLKIAVGSALTCISSPCDFPMAFFLFKQSDYDALGLEYMSAVTLV